jgi:hypothetical protein
MQCEYEIGADEYVASQLLYAQLSGSRPAKNGFAGILVGLVIIAIGYDEKFLDPAQIILAVIGAWFIYWGVRCFFPARHLRQAYAKSELAGKKFMADVNRDGFEVTSELWSWGVRWPGVRLKGEEERVFIFSSQATVFMFGKRFLNNEQQEDLRRLSGLSSVPNSR